jgi:GntR family transcriptional regulator
MPTDEFAPPKYAQIVQAIRRKIDDGTYPPGSMLPSETQLVREFGVSRPTVVRALQVLQLRGIIDREHGKGSFVKTALPLPVEANARPVRALLDRVEADEGAALVESGAASAPVRVTQPLDLPDKSHVMRRRVLFTEEGQPSELVTFWCPVELAEGTDFGTDRLLGTGVRQHLQALKGVRLHAVAERVAARHATSEEAKALGLGKTEPVLGVLARVFDSGGRVRLVADVVLPGGLHELEDTYSL